MRFTRERGVTSAPLLREKDEVSFLSVAKRHREPRGEGGLGEHAVGEYLVGDCRIVG